ncbi:MAG TPA: response regulator transcription factor [Candidatus Acidoferrum sp.]|nr:response regulator transcription factor [Candidatus Acidoferrum sp.]
MKILYIDDNRLLTDSVKSLLSPAFIVDAVHTGSEGIEIVRSIEYSLVLLDLGLPDMDGRDVCRALRSANVTIPILVLTVQKDLATSVQLLNYGADDFLNKPFSGDVLKARVNALLRRSKDWHEEKVINICDLKVNVTRRQVTRSGVTIALRRKEFDILEYLASNQGRALTRAMILDHVWESGTEGWNNTVDVHIKHLRDKVDRPFGKSLIKTAHGIGYMIDDV